jgi:hypothetical protein
MLVNLLAFRGKSGQYYRKSLPVNLYNTTTHFTPYVPQYTAHNTIHNQIA